MVKVMLLDDEENAVDILEVILQETGRAEVIGKCTHPEVFFAQLEQLQLHNQLPDVVFIDIEMPEMNGVEVADLVKEHYSQVEVVFVTAYSEYAIQAFELHSLDYLLKPTNRKRVEKTLARLKRPAPPETISDIYIQSFGEFAIFYDQRAKRLKWRTGKVKELCAHLLIHYPKPLAAHVAIERLFPDMDYERAKILFYTSMSYLRKALKEIGYANTIQKLEDGYVWSMAGVQWDYFQLMEVFHEGRSSDWTNGNVVQQMIELYRGDYFENFEQHIFVGLRLKLRQQVLDGLRAAIVHHEQAGDQVRVTNGLLDMVRIAPESEELTLRLMKQYVQQGRRTDAMQVFLNYKQHLLSEFDIMPSEEITNYVEAFKEQPE